MTQKPDSEKIKNILENVFKRHPEVAAAWLFGSQVTEKAGPMSDVDIALLFKKDVAPDRDLFRLESVITNEVEEALKTEIDVVNLGRSKLVFQHNVLRTGRLLYEGDPKTRVTFTTRVISDFCDFEPKLRFMEKLQTKARIKRLAG